MTWLLALAAALPFEQTDLFRQGERGVHTYRIPAMAVTRSGAIIVMADARHDNTRDLPGNIDLVQRVSRDNGRTWSAARVIVDLPEGIGAGDPSLLYDRRTRRLFCFFASGPPGVGFPNTAPGPARTLRAMRMHSDDEGATWSAPVELNAQIKDPAWRGIFAASGHGIQLRSGRLLQPYVIKGAGGEVFAANAYSDDHGETWRMGGSAGPDGDESKAVELRGGAVMQNQRHMKDKHRWISISRDGGVTFSGMAADTALIDPRVNGDIIRGPRNTLLFSNPAAQDGRRNLTVRVSRDEGKSWQRSRVVHAGPAAYSTMAVLADGSIALLYERGEKSAVETITFARFPLDWIR